MEQDRNNTGPPGDGTSALFVSARKKQLEAQEAEQRAKEKELSRLKAEEEVARMEREVEERKRMAEEGAAAPAPAPRAPAAASAAPAAPAAGKSGGKPKLPVILGAAGGAVVLFLALAFLVLPGKKDPHLTDRGIDLRGVYYAQADPGEFLEFRDGGAVDFTFGENKASGTYLVEGEVARATFNGTDVEFSVVDGATLEDKDGVVFTRTRPKPLEPLVAEAPAPKPAPEPLAEPLPAAPAAPAFVLNPEAPVDKVATVEVMKLGVPYPSSQFAVGTQAADTVVLFSNAGNASVIVKVLQSKGKNARQTVRELTALKDGLLASMRQTVPGGLNVTENKLDSRSPGKAHFKATFNRDGETRYMYAVVGSWRNERDKTVHYYVMMLECPVAESAEYQRLLDRMFAGNTDV